MSEQQSSVIVTNLSEVTTFASLRHVFGELFGPVRHVDVIRGRNFGFVRFADEDDAKKAVTASRTSGIMVDGNRVQVNIARIRGEKKKQEPVIEKTEKNFSIYIFGVQSEQKALYKRLRKIQGFMQIIRLESSPSKACPEGKIALVKFESAKHAATAVKCLDDAVFKGVHIKARSAAEVKHKTDRLILRNLSFDANKEDVWHALQMIGPLRELHLPQPQRGFCFLQFFSAKDAANALRKGIFSVNDRDVALDTCVDKQHYAPKTELVVKEQEDDKNNEKEEQQDEEDVVVQEDSNSSTSSAKIDNTKIDDAAQGKTIFVRNLPYGATSNQLKTLFPQAESIYIVHDKVTGLPRGSAFVKFKDTPPSSIIDDLKLELDGRELHLTLAVPRAQVSQVVKSVKKEDKRHLALLDEGFVAAGTTAAEGVPRAEIEKRAKSRAANKRKLTSPLFFVNPTRISIRNLNSDVDEKSLRNKIGQTVRQLKILTDENGRSRGFAFAEFDSHQHALNALRLLNNNPKFSSSLAPRGGRLIVEFAVENKIKADQRAAKKLMRQSSLGNPSSPAKRKNENDTSPSNKRPVHENISKKRPRDHPDQSTSSFSASLPKAILPAATSNSNDHSKKKKKKGPEQLPPASSFSSSTSTTTAADIKAALANGRAARWFE